MIILIGSILIRWSISKIKGPLLLQRIYILSDLFSTYIKGYINVDRLTLFNTLIIGILTHYL